MGDNPFNVFDRPVIGGASFFHFGLEYALAIFVAWFHD
jgi:hypothetical protein